MVCSGTSANATGILLGLGMQRDRMNQARGLVVIRNAAGALGCLGSPGGGKEDQPTGIFRSYGGCPL